MQACKSAVAKCCCCCLILIDDLSWKTLTPYCAIKRKIVRHLSSLSSPRIKWSTCWRKMTSVKCVTVIFQTTKDIIYFVLTQDSLEMRCKHATSACWIQCEWRRPHHTSYYVLSSWAQLCCVFYLGSTQGSRSRIHAAQAWVFEFQIALTRWSVRVSAMDTENSTNLYLQVCQTLLTCSYDKPSSFADLYKFLPWLRQSLTCCVCSNVVRDPMSSTESACQHFICKYCNCFADVGLLFLEISCNRPSSPPCLLENSDVLHVIYLKDWILLAALNISFTWRCAMLWETDDIEAILQLV